MAYTSGTVANPAALRTLIENFCTTNGWTLNAGTGSWLSKGQSHVRFSGPSSTTLTISGSNSVDGTVGLCPSTKSIYIPSGSWPLTYYMFLNTSPDQFVCVLQYDIDKIQHIMFGDIVKIHNSAYVGGNWFSATRGAINSYYPGLRTLSDTGIVTYHGEGCGDALLFSTSAPPAMYSQDIAQVHHKIDGKVWPNISGTQNTSITYTDAVISQLYRSPNTWNNQAILIPMHLQYVAPSSLYMYLGYIEHVRLIRIDNYQIGDIITLGSDQWKVYPFIQKDTINRNGTGTIFSSSFANFAKSGTAGFAVRYTP